MEQPTELEKDLARLIDLIDEAYRPNTRSNYKGSEILDAYLLGGLEEAKKAMERVRYE